MNECFSENYVGAREKFIGTARAAGAVVESFLLPERGPDNGELATDIAWLGRPDAPRVLVTTSGTHGVEGFFGSATQIEWLRRAKAAALPKDVAVLHVHAINPYGFAWLRRTNEQNIDINRNWIDFERPLPENSWYDDLSDDLCPADWSNEAQARTGARLAQWIQQHGFASFQQAVSGGQWQHPRGIFYGGTAPSWSRKTFTSIIESKLGDASRVNFIDFHTGLGPYGYAEIIIGRPRGDPGFVRTRSWIGAAARSLYGDGSASAEIKGDGMSVLPALLPHAVVDAIALECGIRPITEVALALRADAWLHAYGDLDSPEAKSIKSILRGAFHSDDLLWQGMALGQGLAACQAAMAGLL
ncbi:MAG TPA: M14 family metallopeptidase [Steroidobacteraceae bacterium]